jgi:hypothetical protein
MYVGIAVMRYLYINRKGAPNTLYLMEGEIAYQIGGD